MKVPFFQSLWFQTGLSGILDSGTWVWICSPEDKRWLGFRVQDGLWVVLQMRVHFLGFFVVAVKGGPYSENNLYVQTLP